MTTDDLIDVEQLNIKGELVGEENESFDIETAFAFDEDNTIEIINKIKKIIDLDNDQNEIIKSLNNVDKSLKQELDKNTKEIKDSLQTLTESINKSIEELKESNSSQDKLIETLNTSLETINSTLDKINQKDISQDELIKSLQDLTKKLETNITNTGEELTKIKEKVDNIPSDVSQFSEDIKNLMKTLGIYEETYSASSTYAVGDLVVHSHKLYECITAITTGEAFNSSKWQEISLLVDE